MARLPPLAIAIHNLLPPAFHHPSFTRHSHPSRYPFLPSSHLHFIIHPSRAIAIHRGILFSLPPPPPFPLPSASEPSNLHPTAQHVAASAVQIKTTKKQKQRMANSFSLWRMREELISAVTSWEDQSKSMAAPTASALSGHSSHGDAAAATRQGKARPLPPAGFMNRNAILEGWKLGVTGQKSGILDGIPPSNASLQASTDAASPLCKSLKTLSPSGALSMPDTLGGYIFVCNNGTMQEDLRRQLLGLPQRYLDSVRAIRPGLPLFLYNYTTRQLHGVLEATSFGGTNIDPAAWADKKCKGESRFPAQVRVRVRKLCKPLEEDSFRPLLHHNNGPKFRLQLSIPETLALLDLFDENELSRKAIGQCAPMATFKFYNSENSHKGLSPHVLSSGIKA